MPKSKTVKVLSGAPLTLEDIQSAVDNATKSKLLPPPFIIDDGLDSYKKTREYNKTRFINYCHPGTVLEQATSKVKWTVNKVEEVDITEDYWPFISKDPVVKKTIIHATSEKGYNKRIDLESFYMYDIIAIPKTVEVLWGSLKDNPRKSPKDFANPYTIDFTLKLTSPITFIPITLEVKNV
jgi:hypothetical protein